MAAFDFMGQSSAASVPASTVPGTPENSVAVRSRARNIRKEGILGYSGETYFRT
jgi:hypothetical protein